MLKMCSAHSGSGCIDQFTPPTGLKHLDESLVHTSPRNSIPVCATSVKHLFTASYSKWTTCHYSGYTNSGPFGKKSFKILSIKKSKAE